MKAEIKSSGYRDMLTDASRLHWFHWAVIFFSSLLTFFAWLYSQALLEEKITLKFEREVNYITEHFTDRMKLYENVLWSGASLLTAFDGKVSHQQWYEFAHRLQIDQAYPGINGIGVIYNIKPENMAAYLQWQHIEQPEFSVHPQHTQTEFWPITYIEPEQPNKNALGLDIAFETNRYNAVIKARDSATAQITGPINIVQDNLKAPGFLFYAPFYKAGTDFENVEQRKQNILGVTYAPFIVHKLMEGTLSEKNRHIHIEIHDGDDILIYSDKEKGRDINPLFSKELIIEIYGRHWLFLLESDLSFRAEIDSNQSVLILIGGGILDLLLLYLFIFLTKANKQALNYAEYLTTELRQETEKLEKSNQDLQQFSYVASHDLKSPLTAIKQLASWIIDDCEDILPEESKKHLGLLSARTERLMKLLSDLLTYSKLSGTKEFDYQRVNLQTMVMDSFQLNNDTTGFSCSVPDIEIDAPFVPFEITLRNIISNAIKHHDKGEGKILVSYQKTDAFHVIEIADDGPGIPQNLHGKAMEMFQTLKPRDNVEGSGMGLAIVKKVVEQYGGKLNIKAHSDRGTIVIIHWPLK